MASFIVEFATELKTTVSNRPVLAYAVFAFVVASFLPGLRFNDNFKEEHCVLQAEAFLHGRVNIEVDAPLNDLVIHGGKYYIVNPPFPSILMVPFVAVFGKNHAHGLQLTSVLTLVNLFQIWLMARRVVHQEDAIWLGTAFLFGTGYWFCLTQSDGMWFLAHVVSFTFLLAATNEALGQARGWLTGLFLGASFLSRQATIYVGIFLAFILWTQRGPKQLRKVLAFGIVFAAAVSVYLWFNWLRFGNPLDTGYSHLVQGGFLKARQDTLGIFHGQYILPNAITMLFRGFDIELIGDDLLGGWTMSLFGTSLTFASPFLFLAFRSHWKRGLQVAAWISVALTAVHVLSYHANGWIQINCYRYALDFIPLLLPLCATAIDASSMRLWRIATTYAIGLNALALVLVPLTNVVYQFFG